jgi:hypothetical protein
MLKYSLDIAKWRSFKYCIVMHLGIVNLVFYTVSILSFHLSIM